MDKHPGKLLIVEDYAMWAECMRTILSPKFSGVDILCNGTLAERAILESEYALVSMDEKLPCSPRGSSIIREVLKQKPSQRFVLITAYADEIEPIPGVEILQKPLTPTKLTEAVARAVVQYERPKPPISGIGQIMVGFARLGFGMLVASWSSSRSH